MTLPDRDWTQFAIDAEVEHFGTKRIVAAHNELRRRLEDLEERVLRLEIPRVFPVDAKPICGMHVESDDGETP